MPCMPSHHVLHACVHFNTLQAEEAVRKLDADLATAKGRVAQLEGALRGRDKDMDALQRLLEGSKVGMLELGSRCQTTASSCGV